MMKIKAIVFGKKNCSYCDNRKEVLKKFPAVFKKRTGKELEIELEYHDIKTVDGLVALCKEERTNADIPIVILEDPKGETLGIWPGAKATLSSRELLDVLQPS